MSVDVQAVNQTLYAELPFDSVRDFETVATIARTPFILVVAATSPIRDFKDLIARAKAQQLAVWAMTDVMGGQVDSAFAAVPSAITLVRGGKLRALAVSSAKRNASAPDVPTIAELGYPDFDVNPWWGILAPAGTPRAIVDKVNADVAEVLRAPETHAFLKDQGSEALVMSPQDCHDLLVADVQ